ncbi:MAG: M20/M25/M40 family metallo-hydrolase [Candidatus Sumerlaeota bacterium]|nr:M20/M25/M40 family metallo-hydrolase [Candidatus Sumerlaeota bacterium]
MKILPQDRREWKKAGLRMGAFTSVFLGIPFMFASWCSWMPGESHRGAAPPLTEEEEAVKARVQAHIEELAGRIGERSSAVVGSLNAASDYIAAQFADAGYEARFQEYGPAKSLYRNVEAELAGGARSGEIVVVGAHYDSVAGTIGADDNATGVAALIEIARSLRDSAPAGTIRFVAFANEEPPFFQTENMGSFQYAARCRANNDNIVAMFALESLGYYDSTPGSQKYPALFRLLYPSRGDFVGFVGNWHSRRLTRRAIQRFRETTPFPSEGIAAPEFVPGVGLSDQWSFWRQGYSGVMVTDTAMFRNPNYHQSAETVDSVCFDSFARVTVGLARVIQTIANG